MICDIDKLENNLHKFDFKDLFAFLQELDQKNGNAHITAHLRMPFFTLFFYRLNNEIECLMLVGDLFMLK